MSGCFWFLNCHKAASQIRYWQVTGTIVNEERTPLHLVTVSLLDSSGTVVKKVPTDRDGRFMLEYTDGKFYTVYISHLNYKDYRSGSFGKANSALGTIRLESNSVELDEVTIQSKRPFVELNGSNVVFNVDQSINAQGANAIELLKRVPGVDVVNESSILLNGKEGVLVYLDGRQTFLSTRELLDLLKSMSSSQIKAIELIHSPGTKYDAEGTGGIINIKTIKSQLGVLNSTITTGISYGTTFRLNFVYKLANNKIRNHRNRDSALESEHKRIK